MRLLKLLGKIVALPIRVVNAPMEIFDKLCINPTCGDDDDPKTSAPGRIIARVIEDAIAGDDDE